MPNSMTHDTTSLPPMRWDGVGPRMGLAFAPCLAAAIWLRAAAPTLSAIPLLPALRLALGAGLLALGLAFWSGRRCISSVASSLAGS